MLTPETITRQVRQATNMSRNRDETNGMRMLAILIGDLIDDDADRMDYYHKCGLFGDTDDAA